MVRDGRLTAGHARTLLSAENPEKRAREILEGALNVREAEQRSAPHKRHAAKSIARDPNIEDYERRVSNALGLKVQILHKGDEAGELRVQYSTLEQLEDVVRRLSNS